MVGEHASDALRGKREGGRWRVGGGVMTGRVGRWSEGGEVGRVIQERERGEGGRESSCMFLWRACGGSRGARPAAFLSPKRQLE